MRKKRGGVKQLLQRSCFFKISGCNIINVMRIMTQKHQASCWKNSSKKTTRPPASKAKQQTIKTTETSRKKKKEPQAH